MSSSALCKDEINRQPHEDANGELVEEDGSAESKRFKGKILYDGAFALVIQELHDSDRCPLELNEKAESKPALNSNFNNNNCNNVDELQLCEQTTSSKTSKYLAMFQSLHEEQTKSGVSDSESRIFFLHSFENGDEETTKLFLENCSEQQDAKKKAPNDENESCSSLEPFLMCIPCRLTFTFGPSFAGHVINHHGLDLTDLEIQILELDKIDAVLQKTEDNCQVWYMEPSHASDIPAEELEKLSAINEKLKVNEIIKRKAEPIGGGLSNIINKRKQKKQKDESDSVKLKRTEEDQIASRISKSFASLIQQPTSAAEKSALEDQKSVLSGKTILPTDFLENKRNGQGLDLTLAGESSQHQSPLSLTSSTSVAKQRMLDCKSMSFAVASPLDPHAQSPTGRPILMKNVMHNDVSTFTHERSSKSVEFAAFLTQRKSDSEQAVDENPVSTSQSYVLTSSPLSPSSSSRNERSSSPLDSAPDPVVSSSLHPISLGSNSQNDADSLLNNTSSVDSMFPISLFQSRNSCKTLKCPKCNWHYKYRQTLEAHMKEKHFDETSDCVYCNASQPHPRLSRGESYSCGYKPFKCNVCNYSTTTKGNLSIHMQSDKHLYNARSLQQRHQDRMRQGGTSFAGTNSNQSENSSTLQSEASQLSGVKRSASPAAGKTSEFNGTSIEKQIQSRRRRSSNKTSSSVDSGVYSTPSKTDSPASTGGRRESTSSSGGKWLCDVCCYETAIARNLRIHMTSEKHAQNLALSEKGLLKHMRPENDANRSRNERNSSSEAASQLAASNIIDYYAAAVKSLQQNDAPGKALADAEDVRKAQAQYLQHQLFLAQQQQVLLAQQYQQIMMAAAASSLQQRLSQSTDDAVSSVLPQTKQQEMMLHNQIWKHLFPQANSDSGVVMLDGTSESKESSTLFSCGLCGIFGSDDIKSLESHVRKQRPTEGLLDPVNTEWVVKERSRDRENYFCKLCSYSTTLKTNFNLHCKTEKHSCKLNLISHVREGGSATEWMVPHIIRGNLSQSVACNACQFVTHSLEKLKIHSATDQHQGVAHVCQYLQTLMKNQLNSLSDDQLSLKFRCLPCSAFSTKHVVEMVKHMQTAEHQTHLQTQKNPGSGTLQDVVTIEEFDSTASAEKQENERKDATVLQCEYCNYSCDDHARMQLHCMTQHNNHPPTSCPLCQELLKSPLQLRLHLLQTHQLQISPGESLNIANGNPAKPSAEDIDQTSDVIKRSKDFDDVRSAETAKHKSLMDCTTSVQGNQAINEDLITAQKTQFSATNFGETKRVSAKSLENVLKNTSAASQTQGSNKLIMQILKHDNAASSSKTSTPETEFSLSQTTKNNNSLEQIGPNSKPAFLNSPRISASQSCPDLVESMEESHSRFPVSLRKNNHLMMRSLQSDESSEKILHRQIISKYGLEQPGKCIENGSSNENRSRTFAREKEEDRWPASFSDPDIAEKEEINIALDRTVRKMTGSTRNHHAKTKVVKEESFFCAHCGKEFTSIWILKAHEEVAHGMQIPENNIRDPTNEERLVKSENGQNNNDFSENQMNMLPETGDPSSSPRGENKTPDDITALQQQLHNQTLLQALLKMQSMKQAESLDSDLGRLNPLESLQPGALLGDAGGMPANLMSQMGMYSAILQSQALGLHHPYQLLSNVAALQQMQQLGNPSLLGLPEDLSSRAGGSALNSNLPQAAALASFESQYRTQGLEALQKHDISSAMEASSLLGHIQNQSSMEIPAKRPRTRITDEQLKILRANFDINNSPSEDQIDEMAQRTTLPPKVIKHWFRNTLFKERQRSKDSPYNFNIPPVLSLEDAQKSNSEKQEDLLKSLPSSGVVSSQAIEDQEEEKKVSDAKTQYSTHEEKNSSGTDVKINVGLFNNGSDPNYTSNRHVLPSMENIEEKTQNTKELASLLPCLFPKEKTSKIEEKISDNVQEAQQSLLSLAGLNFPKQLLSSQVTWQSQSIIENDGSSYDNQSITESSLFPTIPGNLCRRTPRTRFTDFQLQVLQEFFDRNAYPKDDDLDKLSQTLNLSTRVIVVWFQNARQKARKSYEQQQQHYQQRSQTPPGMDSLRSSLKADERLLSQTSKEVENFTRKTPSEILKKSAGLADASNVEHVPSALENVVKSATNEAIPCQMCDKILPTFEEWRSHQQDHLKVNFASIFGAHLKGLPESQNEDKMLTKLTAESEKKAKLALGNPATPFLSPNTPPVKDTLTKDDYPGVKQSAIPGMAPIQPSSLSLVGAAKRKASSSPTLPLFAPSVTKSVPTSTPMALHSKLPAYAEDKDGGGMHKDPKRLRTTITPDQLEYLYQQYLFDSSPSRKVIEQISEVVGLKKRVVQVWFQNTRARERKGQFRSSIARCVSNQMAQNKLCHLCRMIFRSKEELDHHIQTKHVTQVTEPTDLSMDTPAEKKMKFSTQADHGEANHTPAFPTVQAMLSSEQLKSSNAAYHSMIKNSVLAPNVLQNIKTEPPVPSSVQSNTVKEEQSSLPPSSSSQNVDYNILFGRSQGHLSAIDLQSKLASLYSSSSAKDVQVSGSSLPKLPDSPAVPEIPSQLSAKESAISAKDDRKFSDSGASEEDIEAIKSRDTIQQHVTNATGFPTMIGNNSFIDASSIPPKRHRTQMTSAQVRALKHCYRAFKTPSFTECELIGNEVGFGKRVVRVWFQNARAKEKKQKLRQAKAGQMTDTDLLEKDDVITHCDICTPTPQFASTLAAREHYFSRDHLQNLMRAMERERKQDGGPGFNTSHSSPCSSYGSSENAMLSETFGSDSLSEAASPMGYSNDSPYNTSSPNPSKNPLLVSQQGNDTHQLNGDESLRKFSEFNSSSGHEEQMKSDYSQLFATNPSLLQHYQKAMQQVISQQEQNDQENASQAIFQQALQKSLYQILKLPQTSPAESQ